MDDSRRTFARPPSGSSPPEHDEEPVLPRHSREDPVTPPQDESAAEEARSRYRGQPMVELEPDDAITRRLRPGEVLLAIRRAIRWERRQDPSRLEGPGLRGDLYLTSARLELLGEVETGIALDDIDDVLVCGERLLLVTRGGAGITLDAESPRLLRVEIAAARAAARA